MDSSYGEKLQGKARPRSTGESIGMDDTRRKGESERLGEFVWPEHERLHTSFSQGRIRSRALRGKLVDQGIREAELALDRAAKKLELAQAEYDNEVAYWQAKLEDYRNIRQMLEAQEVAPTVEQN